MMEDKEMQILKDRIRKDGKIREGNVLKVDSFLNHQMDVSLFREIGKEFKRRFEGEEITKILTIEASGIGIACIAAPSRGACIMENGRTDCVVITSKPHPSFSFDPSFE